MVFRRFRVFLLITSLCSFHSFSQEQIVTNELSLGELRAGQSLQLNIIYDTTDQEKTAGLGLRLHFNSSAVELGDLAERLRESALPFQVKEDTTNLDNNPKGVSFQIAKKLGLKNLEIMMKKDEKENIGMGMIGDLEIEKTSFKFILDNINQIMN